MIRADNLFMDSAYHPHRNSVISYEPLTGEDPVTSLWYQSLIALWNAISSSVS